MRQVHRRMGMLVALALFFMGCQPTPAAVEAPSATPPMAPVEPPALEAPVEIAPAEPETPAGPPALEGQKLVALEVPGFASAIISVPLGARGPRPILVATHGNFDRPEWQCMVWSEIVGARGFVLCPRGIARGDSPRGDPRFEYASNQALEKELFAGLKTLRERFPAHTDEGPVVYTGFSLGAIMGVAIAGRHPAMFPRLVLIEGGYSLAGTPLVKGLAQAGGRVLIACGQGDCVAGARGSVPALVRAGVPAKEVHGKLVGHSYVGEIETAYRGAFDWLVEGDPRWTAL